MSAIVCGKRSFFEDLAVNNSSSSSSSSSSPSPSSSSGVVSKRLRCSSSPIRISPPRHFSASPSGPVLFIEQLRAIFPDMDKQLLEKALEECGDDLDLAIRRLNELRLGSAEQNLGSAVGESSTPLQTNSQPNGVATTGESAPVEDSEAHKSIPNDGAEWVELFVREMVTASDMDDARARASRALEALEKSILSRAGAEKSRLHQENMVLKQQVEALIQENSVLKRAVSIQHERQKEYEDKNNELQHLKQLLSQYQEQLRTLEVNNYALSVHLKQAQQSNSFPGRFHPDVF